MSESSSKGRFLSRRSTHVVTFLRLALIVVTSTVPLEQYFPGNWLYSEYLVSILVPHYQTLAHVREAQSIRHLVNGRFADAYKANQSIHLPPLLLASTSSLLQFRNPELVLALILLLIDIIISFMIESVGRTLLLSRPTQCTQREEQSQSELPEAIKPEHDNIFPISENSKSYFPIDSLPVIAAQIYYYSPITALSGGVYSCFQNLTAFFLMASLYEYLRPDGSYNLSVFLLAVVTYIEPHHCVFLVPMILWLSPDQYPSKRTSKATFILHFVVWSAGFQRLSYRLVGSENYLNVLEATYGSTWNTGGPNMSVQWYLHMQLFSRFINYFSTIFLGLPFILVAPLTIRLYKYPMVLVVLFSMIWTVFSPVQTLFHFNLSICFFLFCPKSLARMDKVSFFALCCLSVPIALNVVDQWMWLETNTGNANYVFFQSLAYNVFLAVILSKFCSASLQRDKALRLAAKEKESTKKEV